MADKSTSANNKLIWSSKDDEVGLKEQKTRKYTAKSGFVSKVAYETELWHKVKRFWDASTIYLAKK